MKKIVITLMFLLFSFSFLASAYASPVLVGGNSTIIAGFSATPTSGNAPLTVAFTDTSTGGVPTSRLWNFGDGVTSKERNPVHTYSSGGIYTVTLSVSAGTDTDTETVTINVGTASNPPVAAFSASAVSGNAPLAVTFTDQSTGSPTSWIWDFGDGTTYNIQNPPHIYTQAGNYTVKLTVSNAFGSNTLESKSLINVLPSTPSQKTTPTITWSKPADVTFGTPLSSTQLNAVASVPGTFLYNPISGTILNAGTWTLYAVFIPTDVGNYNTASKDVQINVASKPVKLKINDFTANVKSGNVPLRAYFTSSVSGSPTKWIWKFEKSVAQNFKVGTATHIYNNVGVFDVTLTVKDAAGRTDTLTKKAYITVLPKLKPPKVDFSARPNVVKISKTVQFTDKSKNNPTSWTWDFGDGATSILQNPSYAYNSAGKYTVTLTVKNSAGSDVKKVKNCVTVTRK